MELEERWRTTIPGHMTHPFLIDEATGSLFVGDGWGVSFPALRLQRLDLRTGTSLAQVRTRHQATSALLLHEGHLYAATDRRLFELEPTSLSVIRQWDRGLVRNIMALLPAGGRLLGSNWLRPAVGLFERDTGRTARLKVGVQPLILEHGGEVRVIAGFDGFMWTLDVEHGRLTERGSIPPVSSVTSGRDIWAVVAGPAQGGDGDPPVWWKGGTNVLTRLETEPWQVELDELCVRIACDDETDTVWCVLGTGGRLQAVSQRSGRVVLNVVAEPGATFAFLDPVARIVLTTRDLHPQENIEGSQASSLICYRLPMPEA